MPIYKEVFPKAFYYEDGGLRRLVLNIGEEEHDLDSISSINSLVSAHLTTIDLNGDGSGRLHVNLQPRSCHYQHRSNETFAAVSTYEGNLVSAYNLKHKLLTQSPGNCLYIPNPAYNFIVTHFCCKNSDRIKGMGRYKFGITDVPAEVPSTRGTEAGR